MEDVLGGRLADDQREVLVLIVVGVKEGQLLVPVRGVIGGIDVEREPFGQAAGVLGAQSFDAGLGQEVQQAIERGDLDGILEAGERGLAGQRIVLGQTFGNEL